MKENTLPDTIELNGETAYKLNLNPNYYITKSGFLYSAYRKGAHGKTGIEYVHPVLWSEDKDGYYRVVLSLNGSKTYVHIHSLVVEQFIGRVLHTGLSVNHKDGDIHNNCVNNLEIITSGDNTRHAHQMGMCFVDHPLKVFFDDKELWFNSKKECSRFIPSLTVYYLTTIERNEITPMSICFCKRYENDRIVIDAYYNGRVHKTFGTMVAAGEYYGLSRGTVSSVIIHGSMYRDRAKKYHVEFM